MIKKITGEVAKVPTTENHRITLGNENQIMLDGIGTRHYLQQVHGRTIVRDREAKKVLETTDQYAIGEVPPGEGIFSRKDFEKVFLEVFEPKPQKPTELSQATAIEKLAKGGRLISTRKSMQILHVMTLDGSEMPVTDVDLKFLWEGDHIEVMFTRDNVTTYVAKKYPCRDFTRPSHTAVVAAVDGGVKLPLAGEEIAGTDTVPFPKLLSQEALAELMGLPKK